MAISVSYYGNKKPAPNVKPQRVINLPDNTPKDKLPFGKANPIDWMTGKRLVQFKKDEQVKIEADKSITLTEDGVLELVGDVASPGKDKVYGTDSSGQREWRDAPTSIPDGESDKQFLVWNASSSKWELQSLTQITVIVGWRLNKKTHKFQLKTGNVYVFQSGETTEWTDIEDEDGGILDPGVVAT